MKRADRDITILLVICLAYVDLGDFVKRFLLAATVEYMMPVAKKLTKVATFCGIDCLTDFYTAHHNAGFVARRMAP